MSTFPSITPTYAGFKKSSNPNINTVRFADGFEQRQLVGIAAHQNPKIYDLVFNVTETQADQISYFLNERALDQASFPFSPPEEAFSKTGTYSQNGTTITVTVTDHQLFANDSITIDFRSGSASDATFSVVSLTNANTFVVTASGSASTSGNCTISKTGNSQFVCQNWTKTIPSNNRAIINCTFREVFEP